MSVWEALAILGVGLLAGTVNTIVGSGSLITFPTLLAFGYAPVTANVNTGFNAAECKPSCVTTPPSRPTVQLPDASPGRVQVSGVHTKPPASAAAPSISSVVCSAKSGFGPAKVARSEASGALRMSRAEPRPRHRVG